LNDFCSVDPYVGLGSVESNHQIICVVRKTLHSPFTGETGIQPITGEKGTFTNQQNVRHTETTNPK